jgi:hypothetical protein
MLVRSGMTLVGEIDFQLLELNLADNIWMCYPDKRFRNLQHGSFASERPSPHPYGHDFVTQSSRFLNLPSR